MRLLKIIFLIFALAVYFCQREATAMTSDPRQGPDDRPNIIFILADDLDARSIAFMPNLEALIREQGTSFTNYFVNVSLCCPSRSSILRGQYAHNHQVLTNRSPNGGYKRFRDLGHESSTVAVWLQAAGYRTALIGKYLNGYPDNDPTHVPPGWDEWDAVFNGHYISYEINENGRVVAYGTAEEEYETDVLSRKATAFIRQSAGGPPFFIYLAPYAPHSPSRPARRHRDTFPGVTAPQPPSFNEADVSDKPAWVQALPLFGNSDIVDINARYRERLQSMLAVDEMIKSLIDTLAATHELDSTYIFFSSDNGYHIGEHRRKLTKNSAYDPDIHVPLIVRGPGVPLAQEVNELAINIDLAPTFAELAGATTPDFLDGRSLVPLLHNDPLPPGWPQAFIVEHWTNPSDNDSIPTFQAVRTNDYLYVEYITGERELYDRRADPDELQNLYDTADPALIAAQAATLDALRDCAGTNCLITAVDENPKQHMPADFALLQNSPNPFNPRSLLRFALPHNAQVTLKIFDILGREVKTLIDGELSAGEHRVVFDAAGLPAGVYFYQIKTPSFSKTRRALLVK